MPKMRPWTNEWLSLIDKLTNKLQYQRKKGLKLACKHIFICTHDSQIIGVFSSINDKSNIVSTWRGNCLNIKQVWYIADCSPQNHTPFPDIGTAAAEHVISVIVPLNICSVPAHNNSCIPHISDVSNTIGKLSIYHLLVQSIREAIESIHKITVMLKSNEDNSMQSNQALN